MSIEFTTEDIEKLNKVAEILGWISEYEKQPQFHPTRFSISPKNQVIDQQMQIIFLKDWGQPKIKAICNWPKYKIYKGGYTHPNYHKDNHEDKDPKVEICFSMIKSAEKIAKDLQKRLIPNYYIWWNKILKIVEITDQKEQRRLDACKEIIEYAKTTGFIDAMHCANRDLKSGVININETEIYFEEYFGKFSIKTALSMEEFKQVIRMLCKGDNNG